MRGFPAPNREEERLGLDNGDYVKASSTPKQQPRLPLQGSEPPGERGQSPTDQLRLVVRNPVSPATEGVIKKYLVFRIPKWDTFFVMKRKSGTHKNNLL